ncbi:MAG TPA: chemotaxis protein CheW [Kofleriaceae bacterium]|nr:chemotaxis protein CheW [Kofleriaceae bacterium]
MNTLYVLFSVAGTEYVLPAADVVQMESFSGATPVPGTAPFVAGLVQMRGKVVPVVDLRARFGLPAAEPTIDSRVVVVQVGERTVGLLVDSAREVIRLRLEDLESPPDIVAQDGAGFVSSVARAGQRLVMVIDPSKVVGEEQLDG